MSLHYETHTSHNLETFQTVVLDNFQNDQAPHVIPCQEELRDARDVNRSKYLRCGARIISSDERSNAVLCTQEGEWSVWILDEGGEPVRGSYFKSFRAAAFDYAEHVMGCHAGEGLVEVRDIEE